MRARQIGIVVATVLVVAGTLLSLHRSEPQPPGDTVYNGSYVPLVGVTITEVYSSSITMTFPERHADHAVLGGLVEIFGAAVMAGVLGGARRPRPPEAPPDRDS